MVMQFKCVCKSWESLLMDDSILPSDLLMEILSWLPVKTLMQFKCISKSLESLITNDPKFAKLHLKRSPKNMHILLTLHEERDIEHINTCAVPCSVHHLMEEPSSVINEDGSYNLTDKFLMIQEGIYLWKHKYGIVGSCNGLVCLGRFSDVDQIEELWVKLWNPATRLWSNKSPIFRMNLRTEACDSWGKVNCGFGYDDSCDTYKVSKV
ncbi:F-box/kelch-repeat protein At3g23880-like [Lotus japonicus]|uniref:F-box/kelch-repeat protein At3g23880-like n=1 Tax=Lotus japonicus TaxID=34305 RepID=UPI002588F16A|nr:F-box/kelch-repeat protein At3g23880-like [Lotus japonicus]